MTRLIRTNVRIVMCTAINRKLILLMAAVIAYSGLPLQAQESIVAYKSIPLQPEYDLPNILDIDPMNKEALRQARIEISNKRRALRDTQVKIRTSLKNDSTIDQREFTTYFENYYFAKMTQTSPRRLGDYSKLRNEFFRLYMSNANGALRQQLLKLTFDNMSKVASGNFHPAARVNAILLVGKLDAQRGSRSNGGKAPVPYEPALDFLLEIVEKTETSDYLKIPAMVGIQRYAELQPLGSQNALDPSMRNRISRLMLQQLNSPVENSAELRDSHYWMRRQAVQTIGHMRDAGVDSANAVELTEIIANSEERIWLRVDAMGALSQLLNVDAALVDSVDVAESVAKFVADSARRDALYIDDSIRSIFEVAWYLDGEDPLHGAKQETPKKHQIDMLNPDADENLANNSDIDSREILPVFLRTGIRQRFKTILHYSLQLLANETDGFSIDRELAKLDGDQSRQNAFLDDLVQQCRKLMNSTNIVDIRSNKTNDDEPLDLRSNAEKLRDVLTGGADAIENLLAGLDSADSFNDASENND